MHLSLRILPVVAIAVFALGCGGGHDHNGDAGGGGGNVAESAYINGTCPIMDDETITGEVPAELTREFRGKTVAFCCSSCPPAWDKLSDAEKVAKLTPVLKPGVELPPAP